MDWIEQKKKAEERAELRKLNKSLATTKVLKLIDAKGRDRSKCVLGIFEGLSALSAVRQYRDPQIFGAFPLKGKFLNVSELNNSSVIQNDEVVQLMASIGIKLGEEPFDFLELSGNYVEFELNDGTIVKCDMNEEIFINNNWVKVSDYVKSNKSQS